MGKIFFFFLILLIDRQIFCQSARSLGMGNAYTAISDDIFSNNMNSSGSHSLNQRFVSILMSPSPLGLKDLTRFSMGYIEPTPFGNFLVSFRSYGGELYKQYSSSVSYSNSVFNRFSFGINIHYEYFSIKNYGSDGLVGMDIGSIIVLLPQIKWGISCSNLNSPSLGVGKEKTEQVLRTGVSYTSTESFILDFDFVKELKYPITACIGFDYRIFDFMHVRSGINTEPAIYSFGFGINYLEIILDYAVSIHNELGESHTFSLTYSFDSK